MIAKIKEPEFEPLVAEGWLCKVDARTGDGESLAQYRVDPLFGKSVYCYFEINMEDNLLNRVLNKFVRLKGKGKVYPYEIKDFIVREIQCLEDGIYCPPSQNRNEVLAMELFKKHEITMGQAAAMMQCSKEAFMQLLSDKQIPVFDYLDDAL